MESPQKPLSLIRADFIENLKVTIQCANLPSYIISPILKDMMSDLDIITQRQIKTDREKYEAELSRYNTENSN